ncbi:hypothetical protein pneo_cds_867 [Pandoravirus neocaledonia]|uniref:Uncharacterized protein n=1 Tax=Pandoravirus neocaledonia TaxID=2107708 RepID=A0A2U7UDF7_9VIRU|nr:hypothetical protein pneo_cds_867 [Pandoravirus neocaledonia]AVK76474.1 hypothetical protein pneo_cds_867 [Pandoravirus neocaledonia]
MVAKDKDAATAAMLSGTPALPSLALEAIFKAYLDAAFAIDAGGADTCTAHKRRWLALHAPLAVSPEFCLVARRFARAYLPARQRRRAAGVDVAAWEGCDLGAPWSPSAYGTLTVVGSRDCGGKHAATCDVVRTMAGQYQSLYVVRSSASPCRLEPAACDGVLSVAGTTAWMAVATDADVPDAVVRIVHRHRAERASLNESKRGVILVAACGLYFAKQSIDPADCGAHRLASAIDVAKRNGMHVVVAASGAVIESADFVAAIDRLVLVAPGVDSRDALARLFAPAAARLPSALSSLMATVERYDALVFERRPGSSVVSVWTRTRAAR